MKEKSSKFISGVLAFTVYFTIIGLLLFYFNTRHEKKSIHYVKKDEHRIQVALSSPKKDEKAKAKTKPKPKTKAKIKPKEKPKPKSKSKVKIKKKPKPKKVIKKKSIKEKVVKKVIKSKDENRTKPKKKKMLDLFAKVKTSKKKSIIQITNKPVKIIPKQKDLIKVSKREKSASERISSSLKIQKNSDTGVENAYFAKIEEKLKGWPAQNEYAGEMAKVWFKVQPSGYFKFKVITASNNDDFNQGLVAYLKQLQKFGFGRHKGERAYELDVEFVATE